MVLLHSTGNRPVKKIIGFLVMLAVTAALYAQAESIPESAYANVKVWVAPTIGGSRGDREYFNFNLPEEVKGGGYELAETRAASDFYITANLEYDEEYMENVLNVELYNTETGALILSTGMGYQTTEEMNDWNLTTIYRLMANAPISKSLGMEEFEYPEAPKKEYPEYRLFLGVRGGYSLRINEPYQNVSYTYPFPYYTLGHSFEAALHVSYQPWRYVGFQTEAIFTMDPVSFKFYRVMNNDQYRKFSETFQSASLMIPLMVKGVFRVRQFVISPLAGVYLTIPLGQMTQNQSWVGAEAEDDFEDTFDFKYQVPLGWTAGLELGMHLGPGLLFLDIRYAADFTATLRMPGDKELYKRSMVSFSLGYKFGLFKKKAAAK